MANYFEPSQEQLEIYRAWVSERPDCVRKVAEKFQPWKLYRMVECDLPATDEKLGSMDLTVEQVRELIHRIL